jgi:hypothetical protein
VASSKRNAPFLRSILYGWVSWLFAFAIWMSAHPGSTAPFNRISAYMLFSAFYSVFYVLDYIIVVPLAYAVLTELWPASRPWQWAILGGASFALSVPLWEAAFGHDVRGDTNFGCVLATVAGAIAFYALRRSRTVSGTRV